MSPQFVASTAVGCTSSKGAAIEHAVHGLDHAAHLQASTAYLVPGLDTSATALARFSHALESLAELAARRDLRLCIDDSDGETDRTHKDPFWRRRSERRCREYSAHCRESGEAFHRRHLRRRRARVRGLRAAFEATQSSTTSRVRYASVQLRAVR